MDSVAITVCATESTWGADTSRPSIPKSAEEIVASVVEAHAAGASIAHLHGIHRLSESGIPGALDLAGWREMVRGIRKKCDILIQFGITVMPDDLRLAVLEADCGPPDMMSITLNDNHRDAFGKKELHAPHSRSEMETLLGLMDEKGVVPEIEIFHAGSVFNLHTLLRRGRLAPKRLWFNLPFGMPGTIHCPPDPRLLRHRVSLLPGGAAWQSVCFVEPKGSASAAEAWRFHLAAIALGGNVRVGVEDSPFLPQRPAESNAELVAHAAWLAKHLGRRPRRPGEVRRELGLTGDGS